MESGIELRMWIGVWIGMWNAGCGMWNVGCGMWDVECRVWNVGYGTPILIPRNLVLRDSWVLDRFFF